MNNCTKMTDAGLVHCSFYAMSYTSIQLLALHDSPMNLQPVA